MVNDRHCIIHVSVEALLQALHVVISSATAGLTAFDASLDAFVLRAVEEEDEKEVNLLGHLLFPSLQVVFVAGKTVDQEFIVARFLQKLSIIA